jgi:hypothetical protein
MYLIVGVLIFYFGYLTGKPKATKEIKSSIGESFNQNTKRFFRYIKSFDKDKERDKEEENDSKKSNYFF